MFPGSVSRPTVPSLSPDDRTADNWYIIYDTAETDAILCGISAAGTGACTIVDYPSILHCFDVFSLKTPKSFLFISLIVYVRLAIVWFISAIWRSFSSSCFIRLLTNSFIFNSVDETTLFMVIYLRNWCINYTIKSVAKLVKGIEIFLVLKKFDYKVWFKFGI